MYVSSDLYSSLPAHSYELSSPVSDACVATLPAVVTSHPLSKQWKLFFSPTSLTADFFKLGWRVDGGGLAGWGGWRGGGVGVLSVRFCVKAVYGVVVVFFPPRCAITLLILPICVAVCEGIIEHC